MDQIPMSPFSNKVLFKISRIFSPFSRGIAQNSQSLSASLKRLEYHISIQDYVSSALFLSFYYGVFAFAISSYVMIDYIEYFLIVGIVTGLVFFFLIFSQLMYFPRTRLKSIAISIDRNIVFAMRSLLIQLKSGISLFSAITNVSNWDFGELSHEFRRASKLLYVGEQQDIVLEELASRNESDYLRKIMWQMTTSMRSGSDIVEVMEDTVDNLIQQQFLEVREYGNALKVLSLIYLMVGVIVPALGITFLIVIGSFPGVDVNNTIFLGLLIFIIVGQLMYMGIIKSRRPRLM